MATPTLLAGPRDDGVDTWLADASVMDSYTQAGQTLASMQLPLMVSSADPHSRLYMAFFDGTGNDMNHVPSGEKITNVAEQYSQIYAKFNHNLNAKIFAGYEPGVGTQGGLIGVMDSIRGHSYVSHLESMYLKFITQAAEWKQADPDAHIGIAAVGFSRGAVEAALFARLVEKRGIQNPEGKVIHRNTDGSIQSLEFTKPPLVEPGQVKMAVGLYDPVNTGVLERQNAHVPESVVAGLQLTAADERRDLFQSADILPPGLSKDGRFLNATVGGAHSDVGGSYIRDGLSVRSENVMTDFLNKLSDKPLLQHREVPRQQDMNLIHRSDQHQVFYRTYKFDAAGHRIHVHVDGASHPASSSVHVDDLKYFPGNSSTTQTPQRSESPPNASKQISQGEQEGTVHHLPETALLARNARMADLLGQVKEALPSLGEIEQHRVAAAAGVEVQKMGLNLDALNVAYGEFKGAPMLMVDDVHKQAVNAHTSFATVHIDKAVQIPVQDSLAQMQDAHMAQQAQAQEQVHSRVAAGPVIAV